MSAGIAALIAHIVFWVLLVYGWAWGELGLRGGAMFLLLWAAGMFALQWVPYAGLFPSYIAILDIALVFLIFKGDVRLT